MTIPHGLPGDVLDTANWTGASTGSALVSAHVRDVRPARRQTILNRQRHDHDRAAAHRRRLQRTRLGVSVAQLGAERSALRLLYKPEEERAVIRRTLDV